MGNIGAHTRENAAKDNTSRQRDALAQPRTLQQKRSMKIVPKFCGKLRKLGKNSRVHMLHKQRHQHQHSGVVSKDAVLTGTDVRKDHVIRGTSEDYQEQLQANFYNDKPPKFLPKSTKDNFIYDGTFHEAVGSVLLMAEFFAMMPVKGVTGPHPKQLSFSWTYVRTWCSLTFIVVGLSDFALSMHKVLNSPIKFNNIEPLIFRLSVLLGCASALSLARKWPELMVYWYDIESDLPQYCTQIDKGRMAHKIKMVTFVAMVLSLAEHVLNIISTIHYSNYCPITKDPIKNYFLLAEDHIFNVFPYSNWLAWLSKLEQIVATFIWNYIDVFVMVVSIGLSSKFKQLNDDLYKFKGMQMPASFWAERRIQYRNLCILCDRVDNAIAVITMLSFSNNLYFICVQLLKSLNKMPSFAHAMYFYFSLFFLLSRTLAVSLYSAAVNDESRKPLRILRCVPKESWCPEVKRFSEEISNDLVALSGMKFFHLTRKLVLSVAGTIVTYELVLIQFHVESNVWDCSENFDRTFAELN